MQSIVLVVRHSQGKVDSVSCTAADFVAFEQHFDKPISVLEQGRLTYMYWLAWHALQRTKVIDNDFDTFVESVESIEAPESAQDAIPPLESPQPIG